MTRAYYDKKPPKLEAVGNGNYLYRWDIMEEEVPAMEMDGEAGEPRKQWSCREVTIHGTPEYGKCVEAVIRDSRSNEEELSLINQYNAYQQGLSGDDSVVSEYKEHLSFVDGVKKMVREDLGMEVETTKVPVTPCLSDLITLCTALARSTDNGLSCLNPYSDSFRNYSTADGLTSNQFTTYAHCRRASGEMWFGSINGIRQIIFGIRFITQERRYSDRIFIVITVLLGFVFH